MMRIHHQRARPARKGVARSVFLPLLLCFASSDVQAQNAPADDDSAFALHAGAAYARLPDAEFEVVRALSGQDLFSQVRSRDRRGDFAVFVSHRLPGDAVRAYATLGTALSRPGQVLYLGGSLGRSRVLGTVGFSTALVEEGLSPVRDEVFRGAADRDLFAAIDGRREWGFFAAVSFAIIR